MSETVRWGRPPLFTRGAGEGNSFSRCYRRQLAERGEESSRAPRRDGCHKTKLLRWLPISRAEG